MNFCSNCGSSKIEFKIPPGDSHRRFVCSNCHTIFYSNPKIIAGCLVVDEGKVLLCKRAIEPRLGLWNLPGGFLENGETAEEGACRETREEANAKVKIIGLHTIYSLPKIDQVYLHFLAEMAVPGFSSGPESSAVAFFEEKDIPWDEIAFSSTTFALERFFKGKQANALPKSNIGRFIK